MKKIRVAINGFGRIGRTIARLLAEDEQIVLVAINDLHDADVLSHLLKYDSTHGKSPLDFNLNESVLSFGRQKAQFLKESKVSRLPWNELAIDVVLECTGRYKTKGELQAHLDAGAKKVILSSPPSDRSMKTVVLGVNEDSLQAEDCIVSNASCTTNNAAPMIQILNELCDIESCYITTVHSYTGDQLLQDAPHHDWRRGRAAAESIVPTTTGAAKALTLIFPELNDVIGGCGIRVPVPDGSLTDITCNVKNPKTAEEINAFFKKAASGRYKGILEYTEDPIVSRDVIGNHYSCVFDALLTSVINNMVKIVGWYDNEVGYSSRMIDLCRLMMR
ncbi:MAG: type I glyceraldehyde-3-phosphate dehydrogenase [Flavobacteriales bacterium]|jgi:glyceraldehyde 3-phosphate dehydrogenase|nr:type I glyceraldehyde-3-phosphate dehydrogenase [Flavobacteriales bacterium]